MSVDYIDLFGWDTAFGISYTRANSAIKNLKATPPAFHYQDPKSGTSGVIDGKWGDWQLTTRGDGQNVTLQCPITQGTYQTPTEPGTVFDISSTWIEIEVKLCYLDQHNPTYTDPTARAGTGAQRNLVTRACSSDPADPAVSVEASSFSFPNASDPEVAVAICNAYFKNWFTQNLTQFNHVFSILVLNQLADKDQFQWLKPTDLGYAVSSTDQTDTSVFGVLAMTEGRPKGANAHQVDSRLLGVAGGTHSAFAIAAPLFVKKWLMPGLLRMRLGSSADDYVLSNDGLTWENKDDIQWATFTDKNNNPVPAYVPKGKFRLGVVGDQIKVEFQDLYWDIESGVTIHVNYVEYYTLALKSGTDKNGKPYTNVLTVSQEGKPYLTVATDIAAWKQREELGLEIGLAVVGAIVGGLVGGAFDAASEGVTSAAEAAADTAARTGADTVTMELTETLDQAVADSASAVGRMSSEAADQASGEISEAAEMQSAGESGASIMSRFVGKVQNLGKAMWAMKWKLVGSIIGGATGSVLGFIPKIIDQAKEEDFSSLPSLDEFGENCVGAAQWPNSTGFSLTSANLVGALILGGDLNGS